MDKKDQIINEAKRLCEKFINKVESGRARSKETYTECKALLELISTNKAVHVDQKNCG